MKKVDIYSSAGTTDESSINADILQASQPIAKPDVVGCASILMNVTAIAPMQCYMPPYF